MVQTTPKIRFPHIAKLYEKNEAVDLQNLDGNNDYTGRIGKIVHRQNTPLKISIDQSIVRGHISSKHASLAHPPQVLVAKSDKSEGKTIFGKVIHLESEPWSVRGEEKQVSEFVTYIDLKLMREIDDDYSGPPRNQNLEDFGLYLANEQDVKTCYNLPCMGFPFGEMLLSEVTNQATLYYYPYNPNNYQRKEDEWQVDHSLFIVGNQGRGKTNALFYISLLFASKHPETLGKAIIKSCAKKKANGT